MQIPITVFTGYLGSGKTTIIINLVKQMPKDYKIVWLKNEYGDVNIDAILAKENNIQTQSMINGCLCCVLVGKLGNALEEISSKYNPDRIIIETSGSAYPAPIALEIRKLSGGFKLDSIITVIDCINFQGYKDISYTAKLQAEFTDLILLNKSELVDKQTYEHVLDDVYELNPNTPKVKTIKGTVNPNLIFGLDTKLFQKLEEVKIANQKIDDKHYEDEFDLIEIKSSKIFDLKLFEEFLTEISPRYFYRIKGVLKTIEGYFVYNFVYSKFEKYKLEKYLGGSEVLIIGKNLSPFIEKIKQKLGLEETEISINSTQDE